MAVNSVKIMKLPKGIELTEGISEDFFKDDVVISDKLPALYELFREVNGRASPGLLTPERYKTIVQYVQAGATLGVAANAVGVAEGTAASWMRKGVEDPDSIFGAFASDLQRATSTFLMRNVNIIQRAAPDDWKAAAYLLKITNPEVYGDKTTVRNEIINMTTPETKEVRIVISDDEIKKLYEIQKTIEVQNVVDANYTLSDEEDNENNGEKDVYDI